MSGDLTSVQDQMVIDEFLQNLKSLSLSETTNNNADRIKLLHTQLKRAIPNGLYINKPFGIKLMENLYRIIPLFDKILLNEAKYNYADIIATQDFLETLAKAFNNVCLFDMLAGLKDLLPIDLFYQNYITLLKETYFTDDTKYDDLVSCILPIITYANMSTSVTEDKIPANLLSYLLTFTKRNWLLQHREVLVRHVLAVVKSFSKNSALTLLVIRNEWPQACVQWLVNSEDKHNKRPSYMIDSLICLIIQKLALRAPGVQILNQLNCLKRLDEFNEAAKKYHTKVQNNCLYVLHCMIYALLVESDEIKSESILADGRMGTAIHELIFDTLEAANAENFTTKCFHISELLCVLSRLFVNDDILLKSLNGITQLFDCLCQLLYHFVNIMCDMNQTHRPPDNEALLAVTNILWSISFHEQYHEKFQSNSTLMHTLSNLAKSSSFDKNNVMPHVSNSLSSLKKAVEGILWNLKPSTLSSKELVKEKVEKQQSPLAMISYSHSDATFCRELVENLSGYIPVWVDYKQAPGAIAHSDDLWEEIARAMELATVIVLIVSQEYYNSKSCRQELSYASDTLKKRIIPVYAPNQQYRASGWLGIRIAGQKYIHFGRKLFKEAIKELVSIFQTEQQPSVASSLLSDPIKTHATCETSPNKTPLEENNKLLILKDWTKKDIRKWFEDNHINDNLTTLSIDMFRTGISLIIYARHLNFFYRHEYVRTYKKFAKAFPGKKLNTFDFVTFVDALYRLRMEFNPNYMIEDNCDKLNEQQLSCSVKVLEDALNNM